MAINPLFTNSILPTAIIENLTRLLAQLPQSVEIPATLVLKQNSSLLKILSTSVETPAKGQTNSPIANPTQVSAKPILVQIPPLNITTLRNFNTELPIVVTILQKLPVLKLQLSLTEPVSKKSVTTKQISEQNLPNSSSSKAVIPKRFKLTPLVEISFAPKLPVQLKLLIQQLPDKQLQQILKLSKNINSNQASKNNSVVPKNISKTSLHSPLDSPLKVNPNAKINSPRVSATAAIIWPQHAILEKLSQKLISSKLLQLNQQLPSNIKDPFVKVFQSWIKQLADTTSNPKFLQQYIDHPNQTPNKEIKALLKQQAPLWEASIRKQLNQKTSQTRTPKLEAASNNNVKAQLFKIIQSLPVILARLDPTTAAKLVTPETEIWQMIFKTRQLIQQQTLLAIPTSGNLNQPELVINFLEQNLRLLILWLKNVEQQQSEQHQKNNTSQQQSSTSSTNNFRFELPMPASTHSEMVQVEVEQYKKNKTKNTAKWKWKLKIQFDFGEDKRLITKTHVNSKQVLIQFEGSEFYEKLITPKSMRELAETLEHKTSLDCNIEFNLGVFPRSKKSTQSFNSKA